jgi:hypothetical protein
LTRLTHTPFSRVLIISRYTHSLSYSSSYCSYTTTCPKPIDPVATCPTYTHQKFRKPPTPTRSPMSHFAGVSSPMQGSEISAVSTPTVRSRKRAPSEAASKPLIYHWCRFEEEYHPYKQEHVQSLLSIFYRCDIQTADHHHLTPTQKEYLIRPGHDRLYPVDITSSNRAFLLKHHEPFRRLAEAVLLASMKECGWDMWEAYAARMKYGQEGYYRNREYPSWSQDVSSEASVVSQVSSRFR